MTIFALDDADPIQNKIILNCILKTQLGRVLSRLNGTIKCQLVLLYVVLATSCAITVIDPTRAEYAEKITLARTDCKRDDIVGVWICQKESSSAGYEGMRRTTMLLRSNGTGLARDHESYRINSGDEKVSNVEGELTWTYEGKGIWTFQRGGLKSSMQYTGTELLVASRITESFVQTEIYVRGGNGMNLDSYINSRKEKVIHVN